MLEARIAPATFTWDGGGDGSKWTDGNNWVGDVAPSAGSDLVFSSTGAGSLNNDFAAGTHFNTITFTGSGFTLGGNPLALDGALTAQHATGTDTVNLNLTIAGAQSFVNLQPGATLNLGGNIAAPGNLTFDGAGLTNVTGAISGAGGLNKLGTGTLVLTGDNSYTGVTTLSGMGGKVIVGGGGDIAQSISVVVHARDILELDNSVVVGNRIGNSANVFLFGGEIKLIGNATVPVSEQINSLSVGPAAAAVGDGLSTIHSVWMGADLELVSGSLGRLATGGTAKFVAEGTPLGSAGHKVRVTAVSGLANNVTIPWAILDQGSTLGPDFVLNDATTGIGAAPSVTSLAAAGPSSNVKLSASETFTGSKTIGGLILTGSATVSGGTSLQVKNGMIYSASGNNSITTPVRLTNGESYYLVETGSSLTLTNSQSTAITEIQQVTAGAGATTFNLSFPAVTGVGAGGTSATITTATADGGAIQAALQAIPALSGNVSVSGPAGGPWLVSFNNALAGLDVSALTSATVVSGSGDTTVSVGELTRGGGIYPIVSEQQTLTVGAGTNSMHFVFNGVTSPAGSFSATTTPTAVQGYLNNIPALSGNVSVTGANGGPFTITFTNALANREVPPISLFSVLGGTATVTETAKGGINVGTLPAITVRKELGGTLLLSGDNTGFTGAFDIGEGSVLLKNSHALGHIDEFQTVTLGGSLGGTFTLTFNGRTTVSMTGTATTAASLQSALESLPTIGAGNVRVEQFGSGTNPAFRVFFQGALADQDVALLSSSSTGITVTAANGRAGQSGATTVCAGAALSTEDNLNIGNEALTLNGTGVSNTGALHITQGALTWGTSLLSTLTPGSTAITLGSAATIGVDAGQLNLNAAIGGSFGLRKVGAGTLEFQGVQANTYSGTTTVLEGQLNLNKRANTANSAIVGPLTIGDALGAANAARVVLLAPDQIANTADVTVNKSGQLISNTAPASEIQSISFGANGGNFSLTFAGQTTVSLAASASAAQVLAALENLTNIGAGNLIVSGGAGSFVIAFKGALANANLPQLTATSALTLAGAPASIAMGTVVQGVGNEVQAINLASGGLSGSWTGPVRRLCRHE